MTIFADTSGLLAVVLEADPGHARASEAWRAMNEGGEVIVTTNYVVLEFLAVLQRRHGMSSVRAALRTVLLGVGVVYVDQEIDERALESFLAANRRDLSMVDCTSFATMRSLGIERAFTVDPHFSEQGFDVMP